MFCLSLTLPTMIWGCNCGSSQVCGSEHPSCGAAGLLSLRSSVRGVASWTSEAPIQAQEKPNFNLPQAKYLKIFLESRYNFVPFAPGTNSDNTCAHSHTMQCVLLSQTHCSSVSTLVMDRYIVSQTDSSIVISRFISHSKLDF